MKISINDNPIEHAFTEDTSLGQALGVIQNTMIAQQDVITTIQIDDKELIEGQLSEWQDRPLADFESVNVEIMAKSLFASSGLRIMATHLDESDIIRNQIVDLIAQGNSQQAMQHLSGYLQLWDTIQKSLTSACLLMNISLDNLSVEPVEGLEIAACVSRLSEQLDQVKTTLETQDTVMLGDILDYEFGDIAELWSVMLNQLSDHFDQLDSMDL